MSKSKAFSKNYNVLPLSECNATEKLIWTFIAENGEDEYPVRELANEIAITTASVQNGIDALKLKNLLVVTVPGSGKRGSRIRAEMPQNVQPMF